MMEIRRFLVCVVLCLLLLPSMASAASYVLDENGQLMGADDVLVNGTFYDVKFIDGTVEDVYPDYNFTFNTINDGNAAAEALRDQVYNKNDIYDYAPHYTNGIEDERYYAWAGIYTPTFLYWSTNSNNYHVSISYFDNIGNVASYTGDKAGNTSLEIDYDTFFNANSTWAVWELADNTPVPEPATLFLLGSGIVGLLWINRKKALNE